VRSPSVLSIRRSVGATLCALAAILVPAGPAAATSPPSCSSLGLAPTALQSPYFYIDTDTDYLGSYVGYRIANSGPTARTGLWSRLESFTGGVVGPAGGGSTTAAAPVSSIASGGSQSTYAYLQASGATATAQSHALVLYEGRPGSGATELCRETMTILGASDVIKAAANKVTGATVTGSPTLGGTFKLTVTGQTGVIGAGPSTDPSVIRFSPAVAATWPSSSFRLVGVEHRMPLTSAVVADLLGTTVPGGGADRAYEIVATFQVVGPTTAPTPVIPSQNIASGTQVKHTDPSTLSTLAPIPVVTSAATVTVSRAGTDAIPAGSSVPLTATVSNAGSAAITLDELLLSLPAGWSLQPGTTTLDAVASADPTPEGGAFHVSGPITVPASSTRTLAFTATAGTAGTSGVYSAVGTLAGGQVDATADAADDVPSQLTLAVLGAPSAADDAVAAVSGAERTIDVLANDNTSGGAAALTIATPPSGGTATVSGATIHYTSAPGFTGEDTFTYTLTTEGGTATASVTVTVVAAPAPPTAAPLDSSGIGTAEQHADAQVPAGGSVTLRDGTASATRIDAPEGTYVLDADTGRITFAPVLGFTGVAPGVTYRLTDAVGQTADALYVPTVTAPAPPTASARTTSDIGTTPQFVVIVPPAGGAVTLLEDASAVASLTVPGAGVYTLTGTGTITFTPEAGVAGPMPAAVYRISDAYGQVADATYTPTVIRPVPVAADDQDATPAETVVTVAVLANDELSGGAPTVAIHTAPSHGTATVSGTTIRYAPADGFAGSDVLAYDVTTDGGTATAHVAITVTPPAPPAAPDRTSEGVGTAPQVLALSVPPGGSTRLLDADGHEVLELELPGVGILVLDPITGALEFRPVLGFHGPAPAVRYRSTDRYGQSTEGVLRASVAVPDAPPVDDVVTHAPAGVAQVLVLTVPHGGSATLVDEAGEAVDVVVLDGVGTYRYDTASATIVFTPVPGFTGTPPAVRYHVTDAYGTVRTATFSARVDDAPATSPDPPAEPAAPQTPPARSCVSRRSMTLHWYLPRGARPVRQTVRVGGRAAIVLGRSARVVTVSLQGTTGTVRVRIAARNAAGRRWDASRTYHPCRARMRPTTPETLGLRPARRPAVRRAA